MANMAEGVKFMFDVRAFKANVEDVLGDEFKDEFIEAKEKVDEYSKASAEAMHEILDELHKEEPHYQDALKRFDECMEKMDEWGKKVEEISRKVTDKIIDDFAEFLKKKSIEN